MPAEGGGIAAFTRTIANEKLARVQREKDSGIGSGTWSMTFISTNRCAKSDMLAFNRWHQIAKNRRISEAGCSIRAWSERWLRDHAALYQADS